MHNPDSEKWIRDKRAGFEAEEVAKEHFRRIDYKIHPFGVEHLLDDDALKAVYERPAAFVSEPFIRLIKRMPDFMAYRTAMTQYGRQHQIFFVEVKYRSTVLLSNISASCIDTHEDCDRNCGHALALHLFNSDGTLECCLGCLYRPIVEYGHPGPIATEQPERLPGNILFYLCTKSAVLRTNADPTGSPITDRIFLNLAHSPTWWRPTADPGLSRGVYRALSPKSESTFVSEAKGALASLDQRLAKVAT